MVSVNGTSGSLGARDWNRWGVSATNYWGTNVAHPKKKLLAETRISVFVWECMCGGLQGLGDDN